QGYLDNFNLSNGELTVAGWHATDYSQIESNHYLILFDKSNNTQVASIRVTNVARPDVAKAYSAVQSAGQSGFNASFGKVNLTPGHAYQIVSRYSTLAEGNGDNGQSKFTDIWFAPVTLNQQAYSIDNFSATKDGFNVTGWVASDQAINKQNPYLILLNNGKEIARTKLSLTDRPDVAKVYPSLYNSGKSGFDVNLKVDPATVNGTLKILLRFAGSTDGKTDFSDQTSQDYPTNTGNFDNVHITATKVSLSGWHASTQVANRPYEYLIVLDNGGKELYRQQITDKDITRNDVQNVYPYIKEANKSGFQVTMDIPANMQGHLVRFIHRITDDQQGNGNYVDFYSNPVIINLQYNMNANGINRYILDNGIGHANITVNHVLNEANVASGILTGKYSETKDGKPNMVVVHETANPNDSMGGRLTTKRLITMMLLLMVTKL
ncbi:N-acetylmuramoyl-L-alanine amidase, partial [Limosilactobacillus caviae]